MPARAVRIGGRVAAGLVAVGALAGVVVAAVATTPPEVPASAAVTGLLVQPEAIDQQRTCAGPLHVVGEATGEQSTSVSAIGTPDLVTSPDAEATPLPEADVAVQDGGGTPSRLAAPPADPPSLAGAQAQRGSGEELAGLAVAACAESIASSWLVAGATDTGRTSLLTLANPSGVESRVDVSLWNGDGAVDAPGLTDLIVAPGSQRVLSLAGFAPDSAAVAVRVESRGGLVVPALQSSVVRGLEPGGIEITGPAAVPSQTQTVPGVRITTAQAAGERAQVGGSADVAPVVRVVVPGEDAADVTIGVTSDTPGVAGTVVDAVARPGAVTDVPLPGLGDGVYTVTVQSPVPVVASVRTATVAAPDPDAVAVDPGVSFEIVEGDGAEGVVAGQRIDHAWFTSAVALDAATVFATAGAPSPLLTLTSLAGEPQSIELARRDADTQTIELAAGATVSVALDPSAVYTLSGATRAVGAVSYAGEGELAATLVRPSEPLATGITVYR